MVLVEGRNVITLRCRLVFENREDKEKVFSLMRRFSSAKRCAYKRLLEGKGRNEIKREVQGVLGINSRYADDAILKAKGVLSSCKERGQNPKKVVFGERKLFIICQKEGKGIVYN